MVCGTSFQRCRLAVTMLLMFGSADPCADLP